MTDLVTGWPASVVVLCRRGMGCVGCPVARFDTIAQAANAYGFDPGELLRELHAAGTRVR